MKAKAPAFRQSGVPQFGTIRGGELDGWEYTLHGFGIKGRSAVAFVQAHPPGWPFPPQGSTELRNADFKKLEFESAPGNVHRVRPVEIDAVKLLAKCLEAVQ